MTNIATPAHFRAWISDRQGLSAPTGWTSRQSLALAGWSRSVGGSNPYLAVFSRTGTSREQLDKQASDLELFELPAARGCTYVVPVDHFAVALQVGAGFREAEATTAKRHLGVTEEELESLASRVIDALEKGPLDPGQIKDAVGDAVRNLGPEGKKRGLTTTLPVVLARLQAQGEIRRQPLNGRLDTQRYRYERWHENPITQNVMGAEEAATALAKLYFDWTGVATIKDFTWFSALSAKATKQAVFDAGLVGIPGTELLGTPESIESLKAFSPPKEPLYALVGCIDNLFHLRVGVQIHFDEADLAQTMAGEKSDTELRSVKEFTHHVIVDRGRVVGFWDFDPEAMRVRWKSFVEPNAALSAKVAEMEQFVQTQLGDARSFSLDSPESRKKRLAALPL